MLRRTFLKSLPAWSFVFMPWLKPTAADAAKEIPTKAAATGLSQTKPERLSDLLRSAPERLSDLLRSEPVKLDSTQYYETYARCQCCGIKLPFGLFAGLRRLQAQWEARGDARIEWTGSCPLHSSLNGWDIIVEPVTPPGRLHWDRTQQQLEDELSHLIGLRCDELLSSKYPVDQLTIPTADMLIPEEEWNQMVQDMIERRKQSPRSWHVQIMNAWPDANWPTALNQPTEGTDYCWKPEDHA